MRYCFLETLVLTSLFNYTVYLIKKEKLFMDMVGEWVALILWLFLLSEDEPLHELDRSWL